jgi:hypothetical protein
MRVVTQLEDSVWLIFALFEGDYFCLLGRQDVDIGSAVDEESFRADVEKILARLGDFVTD